MKAHKNARTTQYSRRILVERVAQGLPVWQVAQELGVSRQTVQKWLARARAEGLPGLEDRTTRPAHSPTRLSRSKLERISALRLQRLTAEQIAERLRLPRSMVSRHLSALGLGKLPPLHPPPPVVRYEREHPGELIHIDTKNSVDSVVWDIGSLAIAARTASGRAGTSCMCAWMMPAAWLTWRSIRTSCATPPHAS